MDDIREVRLRVMAHPQYGLLAQSRLRREKARLLRELADSRREDARIARFRASMAMERAKAIGREQSLAKLLR